MAAMAFFAIPKVLNEAPYSKLSVNARYLYGVMRDRMRLSIKNEWNDREGTFILMSRKSIAALLGKSLPTVRKIIKELIDAGLMREKRVGLTKCNKIYVQLLPGETESDFQPGEKQGFPPEGKKLPPKENNSTNTDKRGYEYNPAYQRKETKWPKGTVLAQQYTQREYTHEELAQLIEVI